MVDARGVSRHVVGATRAWSNCVTVREKGKRKKVARREREREQREQREQRERLPG